MRTFFARLLAAVALVLALHGRSVEGLRPWGQGRLGAARGRCETRRMCIDKVMVPVIRKGGVKQDADTSWQTSSTGKIVPVHKENFSQRPELITFDAYNTLIQPSQSIGKWYREALNTVCEMQIRLPRPQHFTTAFNAAFAEMSKAHPCFGSTTGMTSRQWWFEVVKRTYLTTQDLNQIDPEEMERLLPEVFEMLYTEVFGTKEGWVVKEDVVYILQKLKAWREQGSGPKLGVVSNFDDRLPHILRDMGIGDSFDFILTSFECKAEKPQKEIFDAALKRGKCSTPTAAYHIGDSVGLDVAGALAAGWTPVRYNEWFDVDFPDWNDADSEENAAEGANRHKAALQWGRREIETGLEWVEVWGLDDVLHLFGFPEDEDKLVKTTILKGVYED